MIKQRSFVLNNNKENNSLITNMESEDIADSNEHDALYPYTKVLSQNNNIGNVQKSTKSSSRGSFSIPSTEDSNNNMNTAKLSAANGAVAIEYSSSVLGAAGKNALGGANSINGYGSIHYTSNTSNGTNSSSSSNSNYPIPSAASSSQSSAVAQQLLNDVRALAAQNQRTEQSLRDLQQKIHLQKGKRLTFISQNENKENDEHAIQKQKPLKPTRNHSLSIQPTSSEILSKQQANGMLVSQGAADHLVNNNLLQQKPRLSGRQPMEIPPLPRYSQLNRYPSQQPQQQQQVPLKEKEVQQASVAIAPVAAAVKPKPQSDEKPKVQQKPVEQTTSKDDANVKEESISVRLARLIINENYSQDILDYLRANEGRTVPRNCLAHHNIPASLRAKMIDWMIEVLKSYKCTEETFFMGVRIMDTFLQKSQKVKEISDLHIIGVACMFIAGKFEEIYPIRLQVLQERIAHKKFSEDQIKDMETEILQTLNFSLLGTSPYEIVMQTLTYAKYQDKFSKREFAYGHKICLYLSKMVLYDYEFNQASSYSLLAASIIFIVFKIFQQINPLFAAEHEILNVLNILKVDQKDMANCSTRIIHLAKNFEEFFPDLTNLKKFNGFEMKSTDDLNGEAIF